jgi:hypothetical protein
MSGVEVLFRNTICHQKEQEPFGAMVGSRVGAGEVQNKPESYEVLTAW